MKYEQTEVSEVERGQIRVQRTYKVLVEPLCFFYLKAYSLNRFELFSWKIYDEAYAKVIEP